MLGETQLDLPFSERCPFESWELVYMGYSIVESRESEHFDLSRTGDVPMRRGVVCEMRMKFELV